MLAHCKFPSICFSMDEINHNVHKTCYTEASAPLESKDLVYACGEMRKL